MPSPPKNALSPARAGWTPTARCKCGKLYIRVSAPATNAHASRPNLLLERLAPKQPVAWMQSLEEAAVARQYGTNCYCELGLHSETKR